MSDAVVLTDRWFDLDDKVVKNHVQRQLKHSLENRLYSNYVVVAGKDTYKTERFIRRYAVLLALRQSGKRIVLAAPNKTQAREDLYNPILDLINPIFVETKDDDDMYIKLVGSESEILVTGIKDLKDFERIPIYFLGVSNYQHCDPRIVNRLLLPLVKGVTVFEGRPFGKNHMYDVYYRGTDEKQPSWVSYHWSAEDILPNELLTEAKRRLAEEEYNRDYRANFEPTADKPFYPYSSRNFSPSRKLNAYQPIVVACRFGEKSSFVIGQEIEQATDTIVDWQKTLSFDNASVYQMCDSLDDYLESQFPRYKKQKQQLELHFYGDFSADDRTSNSRGVDWQTIDGFFMKYVVIRKFIRSCKNIRSAVGAVNARLYNVLGDVRMRLNIKDCKSLAQDFQNAVWSEDGFGVEDSNISGACLAVAYYSNNRFPISEVSEADEVIAFETTSHLQEAEERKNNFYKYCVYMDSGFFSPDREYLKTVADAYQGVSEGRIKKLAVSMPPRAGKSYITSLWVSWEIGRHSEEPNLSIMRNSYGAPLAEKFSYDIRDMIKSDKFLETFPLIKLKEDHRRVEDWAIEGAAQSTYFCAGVEGALTGKGCKNAAIADDLIKNLAESLSETTLKKTWDWYMSVHKSRMESGCPEIHIGTRWGKRDPIGRSLEADNDGEGWVVINVPALDENNRSFCEKVKTTQEYLDLKRVLDEYIWESEFMQKPIEAKGLLFPKEKLHFYEGKELDKYLTVPKGKREPSETPDAIVGTTDTADEGTDFLASNTAVLTGEKVFIHDVIFTQDEIQITMPLVAANIAKYGQSKHRFESNNGGKGFALYVKKTLRKRNARCNVTWKKTTANKETRILFYSGLIKEHFWFRSDYEIGSDYDKFMKNLTSYLKLGKNEHDDAPDNMAQLAAMLYRNSGVGFFSTDIEDNDDE